MSMGHNSGLPDLEALPKSIRDIAETLGMGVVFALVEHFGGVELRIPHKLKPDHMLMVLGETYAQMLCDFCLRLGTGKEAVDADIALSCQRRSKTRPFGGVKVGQLVTALKFLKTTAACSGGTDRRAGLPACRAGSPEQA